MKKVFVVASLAFLAACNSGGDTAKVDSMKSAADSSSTVMRDIVTPSPVEYSSKFVMDDPKMQNRS